MRRTSLVLVVATFFLVSCGSDAQVVLVDSSSVTTESDSAGANTSIPSADGGGAIDWQECGSVLCGTLQVPLDYSDPASSTISIFLTKHPARKPDERIGSLLVNPGGPGFGGSVLAVSADQIYSDTLLDRFDIIGFDPRGTGQSEPAIDCTDDYDHFFAQGDITPDSPQEAQFNIDLTKEFVDTCLAKDGDFIGYTGTNNVARDMDSIRAALGEDKISYFGFSYGSELGSVWVTLFPDTVRAAVLDGAADPNADPVEASVEQKRGFEEALDRFLANCSNNRSCPFNNDGDAEGAFDRLMASIDDKPLPTQTGRPDLTRGMAITAVAQAMYSDLYWDTLASALAAAADGDGSGLLALFDAYFQRQPDGTYGNELEAFIAISCADDPERPSIEEADSYVPQYQAAAPRMSPDTQGNYGCSFWPPAVDPRVDVTGAGAGVVLVIGTTGDPATPLASTRKMVEALEGGRLLVVDANEHTGYSASQCARDAVDSYLVDLKAPEPNTEC